MMYKSFFRCYIDLNLQLSLKQIKKIETKKLTNKEGTIHVINIVVDYC